MKPRYMLALVSAIAGFGDFLKVSAALPEDKSWIPQGVEADIIEFPPGTFKEAGNTMRFPNGKSIDVELDEVKYIGQIPSQSPAKAPFLILSGRTCTECDMNISIYIHSPSDGTLTSRHDRNSYPGKLYYYLDGTLIQVSRMFYGQCVADHGQSTVVWFYSYKDETGVWTKAVYLAEVINGSLKRDQLGPQLPDIKQTITYTNNGVCVEVPGIDGNSEP